jgi:hypothetical protein
MKTVRVGLEAEQIVRVAPKAERRGFISDIGEAVTRFPPKHATLRIYTEANQ